MRGEEKYPAGLGLTEAEHLYREDARFHQIVDFMQNMIERLELTPYEMRQAAMFACYLIEMRRKPEPFRVTMGDHPFKGEKGDKA
jgi:hypothetical protein